MSAEFPVHRLQYFKQHHPPRRCSCMMLGSQNAWSGGSRAHGHETDEARIGIATGRRTSCTLRENLERAGRYAAMGLVVRYHVYRPALVDD